MANTINVNQNNNNVSLEDNNRKVIVTDNRAGTVIDVTQPVTSIVTISAIGPQGPVGPSPDTGSFVLTSSFNAFTASYYADSASFSASISYLSSSFEIFSGSYNTGSFSGSFIGNLTGTSSYAQTASYVENSQTSSFVTASNVYGPYGSNSVISSSYSLSSSYAISASHAESSSYALSSSYSVSSSFSQTASYVNPLHQNVTITGSIYIPDNTHSIYFSGSGAASRLTWNDTDGTLDLGLKGGNVTLQIGQEQVVRVVNKTGTNLLESQYKVARIRRVDEGGAQGQRLAIVLAQANNDANSVDTLGIVTENIDVNQEGFITNSGLVRNINTTGNLQGETWTDGDVLYLSPFIAGELTNIKPQAPNHTVIMGYVVYAHNSQGKIFVKVDNGYEIDELHNVRINTSSLAAGQLLVRSGSNASGVWINSNQLTGSYGLTGSLNATSFTGSFSGSFYGDGSNLTGIVSSKWTGSNPITRQSDVEITGSFRVSGSITGSLFGTSSWANQSISSSVANSASYSLTASYVANAQTASYVLNAVNASTASYVNTLNQDVLITGSLTVLQGAIIYGSSSFQYVTASQLEISASFISVNVFEPAERFGGLKVYDSGSSSATASLAWDSLHNHWVYQNVSGSTYTGGMLLSGPRNTGSLGDEPNLTKWFIPRSDGGDHLDNSQIFTSASITQVTGSLTVTSGITGSLFGNSSTATSASFAATASYVQTAQTASYIITAQTASYVLNAVSSSFATSASFSLSSSRATTSSFALTASYVANASSFPFTGSAIITGSLGVTGSVSITQNITASRAFISSSNGTISGSTLTVYGSGSTQPVFTVQGSQGELFSVTDSLSGSLFSVNDISGLPILEVFSDNTTLIGNYLDPMLITTAKVTQTNSGSFTVYSLPTASYDTAFFEYSVKSGSNARAGTIMVIQSGSSVNFTETTTLDFGSTTAVSFTVIVTGSNMALTGSSTSGAWTIKAIVRGL